VATLYSKLTSCPGQMKLKLMISPKKSGRIEDHSYLGYGPSSHYYRKYRGFYGVKGESLSHYYKEFLSGFRNWKQSHMRKNGCCILKIWANIFLLMKPPFLTESFIQGFLIKCALVTYLKKLQIKSMDWPGWQNDMKKFTNHPELL
jgi:hypothetical protein